MAGRSCSGRNAWAKRRVRSRSSSFARCATGGRPAWLRARHRPRRAAAARPACCPARWPVGPRPLEASDVARWGWDTPRHDFRWRVRPGLTDSDSSQRQIAAAHAVLDRLYIARRSLGDVRMIALSFAVNVLGKRRVPNCCAAPAHRQLARPRTYAGEVSMPGGSLCDCGVNVAQRRAAAVTAVRSATGFCDGPRHLDRGIHAPAPGGCAAATGPRRAASQSDRRAHRARFRLGTISLAPGRWRLNTTSTPPSATDALIGRSTTTNAPMGPTRSIYRSSILTRKCRS